MRVDLIMLGYEISLALRYITLYAQRDPVVRDQVDFHLHELKMQVFERPKRFANEFTPFSPWERLLGELVEARPDVVGLSCYLWNIQTSVQFAEHIKILLPDTLIVLGGPEVTDTAETLLTRHPALDVIVRGEGEILFHALMVRLLAGGDPTDILGTSWRTARGEIRHNPRPAELEPLDLLPSPYAAELARDDPSLRRWDGYVVYESVRGCPFDCGFCMYGRGSHRVRYMSIERAAADMLSCTRAGLKMQVVDSSFGMHKKRTKRLLRALIDGGPYSGSLTVEAHANALDDELCELLVGARTAQIGMGLQSIAEDANELMRRKLDLQRFAGTLDRLARFGLYHYLDVIFGMPGDTYQGLLHTIDFALSRPNTDVQFHRLLILPGTRFRKNAAALGLRHSDKPPYEILSTPTYPYADLIKSHKLAFVYHCVRHALGGVQATGRLIAASPLRPSELLIDLARYLEDHGILLAVAPSNMGDLSYVLHDILNGYLRARGLTNAVARAG